MTSLPMTLHTCLQCCTCFCLVHTSTAGFFFFSALSLALPGLRQQRFWLLQQTLYLPTSHLTLTLSASFLISCRWCFFFYLGAVDESLLKYLLSHFIGSGYYNCLLCLHRVLVFFSLLSKSHTIGTLDVLIILTLHFSLIFIQLPLKIFP